MRSLVKAGWILGIVGFLSAGMSVLGESLFDGETFDGWSGNYRYFRIEEGALVGGMLYAGIPQNEFLSTEKEYDDFELRLKFKLVGDNTNAGIQIRSKRIPDHHEMIGYQADLGQQFWGSLYDESRRRKILAQANMRELDRVLDRKGWNDYVIRCVGRRITLWINGYQTVNYYEPDETIPQQGLIALQIHSGPPGEAWYKEIEITELPGAEASLKPKARGVATRVRATVTVGGDSGKFGQAFATPIGCFQNRLRLLFPAGLQELF